MSYRFVRESRSRMTLVLLLGLWAVLALAWWVLSAAPWILAFVLALTLPAAFDYARGAQSWMEIDATHLRWGSGRQRGEIALPRIAHMRLETRLDLSLRARAVLDTGERVALPQAATPPLKAAEAAFAEAGIETRRHHFSLL